MEVPDGAVLAPKFQAGVGGWEAGSEEVSTQTLGCGLLQSLLSTFLYPFLPQTSGTDGLLLPKPSGTGPNE